ncbi:MAG: hypothetical protein DCC75_04405, partial [Proteobacteria bacterium]
DDDGDLQVDFISPDVALPEGENEKPEEPGETGGIGSARELSAKEQGILNYLRHGGYTLKEVIIENGATVTVFGTYHPAKSAVDIGSALKNLRHQIHLGPIEKVLGAQLRNSILGIIFWGAVWAGAHWYLAKLLGYPIDLRFDLSFLG